MISWLNFFGLSFFSDKIAKQARVRGVTNCVLGFLLTLIFIFCGVLAANNLTFYAHYGNSSNFKSFVGEALDKAALTVENGKLYSDKQVNTFIDESDAASYGVNGYNLIIDTRPVSALDDFQAYCLSTDGQEISYEDYLALGEEERAKYEFKIRYTPDELVLTDDKVEGFEQYLSTSPDEDILKQYYELIEIKNETSSEEYKSKIYALYVSAYYPDISAYERNGEVPLLRSYYYRNYLNTNDIQKSLFIFEDVLLGYFETDGGLSLTVYGYFNKVADGALTKDMTDEFILDTFSSSVSLSANVYLMNIVRFIPIFVGVPLLLAFIVKLIITFYIKDEKYKGYGVCFKIQCSYLAWAALFTAIITFICGYFVSSNILNTLPLTIFALIMAARTVVYLIYEKLTVAKEQKAKTSEQEETLQDTN